MELFKRFITFIKKLFNKKPDHFDSIMEQNDSILDNGKMEKNWPAIFEDEASKMDWDSLDLSMLDVKVEEQKVFRDCIHFIRGYCSKTTNHCRSLCKDWVKEGGKIK